MLGTSSRPSGHPTRPVNSRSLETVSTLENTYYALLLLTLNRQVVSPRESTADEALDPGGGSDGVLQGPVSLSVRDRGLVTTEVSPASILRVRAPSYSVLVSCYFSAPMQQARRRYYERRDYGVIVIPGV